MTTVLASGVAFPVKASSGRAIGAAPSFHGDLGGVCPCESSQGVGGVVNGSTSRRKSMIGGAYTLFVKRLKEWLGGDALNISPEVQTAFPV